METINQELADKAHPIMFQFIEDLLDELGDHVEDDRKLETSMLLILDSFMSLKDTRDKGYGLT